MRNDETLRSTFVIVLLGLCLAFFATGCACGPCGGDEDGGEGATNESGDDDDESGDDDDDSASTGDLKAVSVTATNETSFAVMSDGTVRTWGSNAYGQLGWGDINEDVATPVVVKGLKGVEELFVGGSNYNATACAKVKGGKVKCWGDSDLIPGVKQDTTTVKEIPGLKDAQKIAFGGGHACAVMKDGTLSCWGRGAFGVLGMGDKKDVAEPTKVGDLKKLSDVKLGQNHTCALSEKGSVWCWGNNFDGQADPTNPGYNKDVMEPKKVKGIKGAKVLGVGANVSCAVLEDDSVKCWGANFRELKTVPDSSDTVGFSTGFSDHTCLIKKNGALWCWGRNTFGQAGAKPSKKKDFKGEPAKVAGIKNVTSVATGYTSNHTCATTEAGAVMCWGRNRFGAIGDGTIKDNHKPQAVSKITEEKLPKPVNGFDKVATRGKATTFPDKLPKGCKAPDDLSVKVGKDKRLKEFGVLHASAIKRERKSSDGKIGDRFEVKLKNYEFDTKLSVFDFDQRPRGLQFALDLNFTRDKAKEKKKGKKKETIKSALKNEKGDYTVGYATGEDRKEVSATGYMRRESIFFSRGFGKSYKGIEITHVSDKWICGKLNLKNDKNHVKGNFAAKVTSK